MLCSVRVDERWGKAAWGRNHKEEASLLRNIQQSVVADDGVIPIEPSLAWMAGVGKWHTIPFELHLRAVLEKDFEYREVLLGSRKPVMSAGIKGLDEMHELAAGELDHHPALLGRSGEPIHAK